ncbi:MAG: hypothetical protein ACI9TH_002879 [Kiritimatiellia bacterium]|jgi:hypothetical protein
MTEEAPPQSPESAPVVPMQATDTPATKTKSRMLPFALSVVMPGAGQCAQKRYVMGVFYILGILAAFVMSLFTIMRSLVHNWQYIFGSRFEEPTKIDWKEIALSLLLFMVIYAINLVDVWWAEKRRTPKT